MKTTYKITMDSTALFIPSTINQSDFGAVRDYVYRLRSEHPSRIIDLWEVRPKLVRL